jgi:hypothetical protein
MGIEQTIMTGIYNFKVSSMKGLRSCSDVEVVKVKVMLVRHPHREIL